jgi:hypothetical protein
MNILPRRESRDEVWVTSDMRKDAQLNLTVIGCHKSMPWLRNKRVPNLSPQLRSYRDVLQIWIYAAQPTSRGDRLLEGCVDATVCLHKLRQRLNIGALQLGHGTPLERNADDWMLTLNLLEDTRIR